MNANRQGNKTDKGLLRKLVMAALAVLVIGVSLFSQSNGPSNNKQAAGDPKLEKALQSLNASSLRPGQTIPVIIQFVDDNGDKGNNGKGVDFASKAKKWSDIISNAGGSPKKGYGHMKAHSGNVDVKALKKLAADSHVARISLDYSIKAHLATTAIAIGADQVWYGNPGYSGNGVNVAVINSGIAGTGDLANQIVYRRPSTPLRVT